MDVQETRDGIHEYFNLTYASYLVLPRTVLQSMPDTWQADFVEMLEKIPRTLDYTEVDNYRVMATDAKGKFVKDDLANYQRGRRKLPTKTDQ